jgi:molybdopterin synthase sulfur carrier subunit
MSAVRVALPGHLKRLAQVDGEVSLDIRVAGAEPDGGLTLGDVLDALEAAYPVLRGTIRDQTGKRRAFIRYFACERDLSHDGADAPLPEAVRDGREPLLVVGAMAGG